MAGHSKWANIQHRKGAQDAKRGKLFTKLIREITVAARMGGGELESNPRLRLAMDKALSANMTKDTIERAIKRGAGGLEGDNVEEICYEGYGPGGIAVMVDCMTDNRNRTVAEVRHAFTKAGGNLGTDGSVSYLFKKMGVFRFSATVDEEQLLECILEAGGEDVITAEDGRHEVLVPPEAYEQVQAAVKAHDLTVEESELSMLADNYVELGLEEAEKLLRLVEHLEDLDDVQTVHTNADIPDHILEQLN